jgi:hypothetical protein
MTVKEAERHCNVNHDEGEDYCHKNPLGEGECPCPERRELEQKPGFWTGLKNVIVQKIMDWLGIEDPEAYSDLSRLH